MQWFNVIQKWESQKNNEHKTTRLKPNSKKMYQNQQSWRWGICQEAGSRVSSLGAQSCAGDSSQRRKWSAGKIVSPPIPSTEIHQHSSSLNTHSTTFSSVVHISGSNFTKVHSLLSFIAKTEWATILNYTLPRSKQSPFHVSQYTQRVHHLQHIPLP